MSVLNGVYAINKVKNMTLHPLEVLLIKCCGERISNAKLTRMMAKVSPEMKGYVRETCDTGWYDLQIKTIASSYKSSVTRCFQYKQGDEGGRPETATLILIQKALGCAFEELLDIYYSEFQPYNLSSNENVQDTIEEETELIRKIPIKQINKEFAQKIKSQTIIEKEFGYKLSEYKVEAEYTKGSHPNKNTLRVKKTYILVPLRDDIKEIKFFDYYRCLRNNEGDIEEPDYSKELFSIQPKKYLGSDENFISLIFHEVLKKNQPVEFFLSYFYEDILDNDIGFHYVWILHPTEKLILKVTSTEPEENKRAKFRKHWFKGCPLGVERKVEKSKVVSLVKDQNYFYKEVPDPDLFITCGFYWHRDYLL